MLTPLSEGLGPHFLQNAWEVFLLFTIPIGGGIPAGVLLAQSRGITWPWMLILYFLSDLVLAVLFEPLMLGFIKVFAPIHAIRKGLSFFSAMLERSVAKVGHPTSPLMLILVAFGVDPMTGRAAAQAAGHGFLTGWAIAIAGDMMYFSVLMVSTLWLRDVLGDGTWAMLIILLLMMAIPAAIRRIRKPAA
ncbi:MAG: hypothetical protein RJB38_1303 [Pseudomonadota bacterium]